MSSPSTTSLRRRLALATGAGALVLLGGAGVAYAAGSLDRSVETGWSTVVDADPAADTPLARDSQTRDAQDCPDLAGSSQSNSGEGTPGQTTPSQDGDL